MIFERLIEQKHEEELRDAHHVLLIDWHATRCQRVYRFYRDLLKEGNRVWFRQNANDLSGINDSANRISTLLFMEKERIRRIREGAASVIIQAYWRRYMAIRLYLRLWMHRDKCATLLQVSIMCGTCTTYICTTRFVHIPL